MTTEIVRRCDFCLAVAGECGVSVFECETCGSACCDEHSGKDAIYFRVECHECLGVGATGGFDIPAGVNPIVVLRGGCEAGDFLPRDFVEKVRAMAALRCGDDPIVLHVVDPHADRFEFLRSLDHHAALDQEIPMLAIHTSPPAIVRFHDAGPMQARGVALAAAVLAVSSTPRGFSNYVDHTRSGSPNWLKIALVSQRR